MEILYYGFDGHNADPIFGWFLIILGIICFLIGISFIIQSQEGFGFMIILTFVLITMGLITKSDNRIPIVKAILNETIPWQEINSKYTLKKEEGKVYTFQVNNMTIEEWEKIIKENSKEN